jgi:frataxin
MARLHLAKTAQLVARGLQTARIARAAVPRLSSASPGFKVYPAAIAAPKFISSSPNLNGITPDDEPPKPKDLATPEVVRAPAEITDNEYHNIADEYLDRLLHHLEDLQDSREDVDVEYSV